MKENFHEKGSCKPSVHYAVDFATNSDQEEDRNRAGGNRGAEGPVSGTGVTWRQAGWGEERERDSCHQQTIVYVPSGSGRTCHKSPESELF